MIIELNHLRYFVAVAEELHFGRAAARLRMTQPPLSRAIKHLEIELGTLLLQRPPTGVALTPAGAVTLEEARALLAQADRMRARIAAVAGPASITIGILGDRHDPAVRDLGPDPVGAVLRADDPLADRAHLELADLADRDWFQFPEGTDPVW